MALNSTATLYFHAFFRYPTCNVFLPLYLLFCISIYYLHLCNIVFIRGNLKMQHIKSSSVFSFYWILDFAIGVTRSIGYIGIEFYSLLLAHQGYFRSMFCFDVFLHVVLSFCSLLIHIFRLFNYWWSIFVYFPRLSIDRSKVSSDRLVEVGSALPTFRLLFPFVLSYLCAFLKFVSAFWFMAFVSRLLLWLNFRFEHFRFDS